MALIFYSPINPADVWGPELKKHIPDLDFRVWEEPGDPAEIDMALCWKPPAGELAKFPNLKVIFSLAAGVDHLFYDPDLPDVPVVRMVEPSLTAGVAEYIVLHVMRHHKDQLRFAEQQKAKVWEEYFAPPAWTRRVGILGLGVLGGTAAGMLKGIGFQLAGWSRSAKQVDGVESFHGPDQLGDLVARSDILVSILPKTPETEDVLNAALFAKMPKGASLINCGRGNQLVEQDCWTRWNPGKYPRRRWMCSAKNPCRRTTPSGPTRKSPSHPIPAATPSRNRRRRRWPKTSCASATASRCRISPAGKTAIDAKIMETAAVTL